MEDIVRRGRQILEDDYKDKWESEVQAIRRNWGVFGDKVLEYALDVIENLNLKEEFVKVKQIVDDSNHSGISFTLLCAVINSHCSIGESFTHYLDCMEIVEEGNEGCE